MKITKPSTKDVSLSLRMTAKLKERLKKAADKHGVSINYLVSEILEKAV